VKNNIQEFRNDAIKAAGRFGTPAYIIYESQIKKNYERFCSAFKKNWDKVDVSYSVKTNYLPAVVHYLYTLGAKIEIVSEFELHLALKTGIPGDKIIFNGPCKTEEVIDFAVKNGVAQLNADSTAEVERIDRVGKKHGKKIGIGIRINTEEMWRKFGVPIEHAAEVFLNASRLENVEVRGIHAHIGTNVSPTIYVTVLERILELMRGLHTSGMSLDFIDLGGGYPVEGQGRWGNPYKNLVINILTIKLQKMKLGKIARMISKFKSDAPVFRDPPPIETFASMIGGALKKGLEQYSLPPPKLLLEPGRYIVNNAAHLLTKVLDIKKFASKPKWVMVDGGTNLAGSTETQAHRVLNVSNDAKETENIILAGPLCHGGDVLSNSATISVPRLGDIIAIFDIGAYNISQSRQFITPRANAVLVRENGEMEEVRRRETYEDILILDSPFLKKSVDENA
jgi:diaminopimelate decarboxylase